MPASFHVWIARIRAFLNPGRHDQDFDRELETHLEMAEAEYARQGLSREDARRRARVELGGLGQLREAGRAARGLPWLDSFRIDVVLGFRMLRRYWGLTVIGGLALSVALGIAVTMFMYFDVFWSASVPLDQGDRVVAVQIWDSAAGRRRETRVEDFRRWRQSLGGVEAVGAFRTVERTLEAGGHAPESIRAAEMTASGFEIARVAPLLGRTFSEEDAGEGADPVAVVGYDLWQSRYSGDPKIVGQSLALDGVIHTVIGVMPEGYGFPINHNLWTPLIARDSEYLPAPPEGAAFARLRAGVRPETVQAQIATIGLVPLLTEETDTRRVWLLPYAQNFIDDVDPDELGRRNVTSRLALLLVSLLLVPPAVNIAVLVYARTVARQEEIAVRTALGASRGRVVVQLFIEMLVLSAGSAALALGFVRVLGAYIEGRLVENLTRLPFWVDLGLSLRTILFAAGLALAAAVVAGLLPALKSTGRMVQPGLRALASRTRVPLGALWTLMIVFQVGCSFAVLPLASEVTWGLLGPTLGDPGFPADQYLTARVTPREDTGPSDDPNAFVGFDGRLEELARQLEDAAPGSRVTLLSSLFAGPPVIVELESENLADPAQLRMRIARRARLMWVDDVFLEAFDVRLLAGRGFGPGDFGGSGAPVIVDQTFAAQIFEGANPVGQRVRYLVPGSAVGDHGPWVEIIGVVADVPSNPYSGTVYHPASPGDINPVMLVQRVPGDWNQARRNLGVAAGVQDSGLSIDEIHPLDELLESRNFGNYLGGLAVVGSTASVLLLSGAGIYALMSFTFNQRRREIGIRSALGASPGRLLMGIFGRALLLVAGGALAGMAMAALIEYVIPAQALGAWDIPGILALGAAFMALVTLSAIAGPALRALRVPPTEALADS